MPRPDLAALGISYRRIPLLAIGRHVYCDSRLILQVLQEKYPLKNVPLSGSDKAVQRLLQDWNNDQIFWHATRCLPFERSAFASSPAFLADRSEAIGKPFSIEAMAKERPESYSYIRALFQELEEFLEDDRDWILGSDEPSLADIDAVYIAQWIVTNPLMDGMLPEILHEKHFPKAWAWVHRFKQAAKDAESKAPMPTTLDGKEVYEKITSAPPTPTHGDISETDPLNLRVGQTIEVYPTDWASNHVDRGELYRWRQTRCVFETLKASWSTSLAGTSASRQSMRTPFQPKASARMQYQDWTALIGCSTTRSLPTPEKCICLPSSWALQIESSFRRWSLLPWSILDGLMMSPLSPSQIL